MKIIPEEDKQKAIRLYKSKYKLVEIANLTGMSTGTVINIVREKFKTGELKPRMPKIALKPKSKERICGYVRKDVNPLKKFTEEQENQIAQDYYVNELSWSDLKTKWGIHPVQMQRIRNRFRDIYPPKSNVGKKYKKREQK